MDDQDIRRLMELLENASRHEMNVHVHLHLDPIAVRLLRSSPFAASHANLIFGGTMPGSINVDTVNESATVGFLDDKGDVAAAPSGATVTFTSDNNAVATVAIDPTNPLKANITPVSVGSANISCALTGAMEADGVTPIPNPAAVAVTVAAGPAAGASLVLSV